MNYSQTSDKGDLMSLELQRLENETNDEVIYRICSHKDEIGTWEDVADVINKIFEKNYKESTYRKKFQAFERILNANQRKFVDSDAQAQEIMALKRELERGKVQYRDERNAWSKQNFADARVVQKLDYLEERLIDIGKVDFSVKAGDIPTRVGDNDVLVCLSDLHLGQCFSSPFGQYNTDIAKERLEKYLLRILDIAKTNKSENCYVTISGDLISGNIHHSIAVTNRENVIDQIKIAVEFIASFIQELCKKFAHVYVSDVSGNHSRMTKKDEALKDERLDNLIGHFVETTLQSVQNVTFIHNNIDIGISKMTIRGLDFLNVHGDYDAFTASGALKLCSMLRIFPYAITYAHMHTCALDEANGIKMIRNGALSGSGDDFTIEKRLYGKASQMVCTVSKDGITGLYPVELEG